MAEDAPILALHDVTFVAGGATLLRGLTLKMAGAGCTMVMGPNGAGKSLLLRLCHGLERPTSGQVLWNGEPLGPAHCRRQAMVFQTPILLRRSTLANVTYPLAALPRALRRQRAREALELFGLAALAERPARVLSGGEQQRLALARAWALRPRMLLLDEPTSALDPAATHDVETSIDAFRAGGIKILMTTHDLGQARRLADEVVLLAQGSLVEHAPAATFFRQPATACAAAFLAGELVF